MNWGDGWIETRRNRAGRTYYEIRWYEWMPGKKGPDRHETVGRQFGKRPEECTLKEAKALLKQRLHEKWLRQRHPGLIPDVRPPKTTMNDVLDVYAKDLERRHQLGKIKDLRALLVEIEAVRRWMGTELITRLDSTRATVLHEEHLAHGGVDGGPLAPGTVTTRQSIIHAAWVVSREPLRLPPPVTFPKREDDNARQVTVEDDEFPEILKRLRAFDPFDDVAEFVFWGWWRIGETLDLTWDRVDFDQWKVWVEPEGHKNKHRKERWIAEEETELRELLLRRKAQRVVGCPYVFHRNGVGGRDPLYSSFNRTWRRACSEAGLAGKWTHDLRRSLPDDGARAGVDREVLKSLGGWRSDVIDRYDVKKPARMAAQQKAGVAKIYALRKQRALTRNSRATGTAGEAGSPS